MTKIRTGNLPHLNIPRVKVPPEEASLVFSFKHLDLYTNKKFCISRCKSGYLDKFLCRLRDLSPISVKAFRANISKALRIHQIDWAKTTETSGFSCLNTQLRGHEAWQFEITANEHGRVHGLLIDGTFFVVWIDPCHLLFK